MHILLVNDDGIQSPGLRELAAALAVNHRVTVAAPDRERSAVGHGITLRVPLFAQETFVAEGVTAYAVSGTPADCTRLGISSLSEAPVDLVVSGPNAGVNMALDLLYSGTVSAALEAAMLGYKGIALSSPREAEPQEVVRVFLRILDQLDLERDVERVLNINVPALPAGQIKGVRWVPQGTPHLSENYTRRESPDGRAYFWPTVREVAANPGEDGDTSCVEAGYVSLTPLTYRITDDRAFRDKEFSL